MPPTIPVDDRRVIRRLRNYVADALDRQVDPVRAALEAYIKQANCSFRFRYDPEGALWLDLTVAGEGLASVEAGNVGLVVEAGELRYIPDPILDDDLGDFF